MKIVGIDPGITGAIAFFYGHRHSASAGGIKLELSHCLDMPTYKRVVGYKKTERNFIDAQALRDQLLAFEPKLALVELVRAQPRIVGQGPDREIVTMGATSAFSFGMGFGMVLGLLIGIGTPYRLVDPKVWKAQAGLRKQAKDASRPAAKRLYPGADLKRKKDHARADAILIAHYGIRIVDGRERIPGLPADLRPADPACVPDRPSPGISAEVF